MKAFATFLLLAFQVLEEVPTDAQAQLDFSTPYKFSTLAGKAGTAGSSDGSGNAALFNLPTGVAVDHDGNVYVADSGNQTIRKVTSAGVVTTLAGLAGKPGSTDGSGSDARFSGPSGIAIDHNGNLYVADSHNNTIRMVTPTGRVATLAGLAGNVGNLDGPMPSAEFGDPHDLAVDRAGNVYVADTGNQRIRKIATTLGTVTTFAGPTGSPFDRVGWSDSASGKVRFNYPSSIALDNTGNLFVADRDNDTIRKVTQEGVVTTFAGTAQVGWTQRGYGSYRLPAKDGTGATVQFGAPSGITVDSAGNLFVTDQAHSLIRKVTTTGMVTTLAGNADVAGSADGTGSAAQFNVPTGIAVDSAGNLYVADTLNNTIRKGVPAKADESTKPSSNPIP